MIKLSANKQLTRVLEKCTDVLNNRKEAIFAHPIRGKTVFADFVPDITPTKLDINYASRLLSAYKLALISSSDTRPDDIWSSIATKRQSSFFNSLNSGDPYLLAEYLCNMSRHDATHGTVQGDSEFRHLKFSRRYRRFIADMAKDKLVSLAEAVGALPCENPEQGVWGHNYSLDPKELVSRISHVVGIDISPPPIDGGLFKIRIGSDWNAPCFGERDCNAIYTGWYIAKSLNKLVDITSVCEIGGGSGRVAYWATRFGVQEYTIYDLPHINVVQGFYLLKALGNDAVRLYGELGNGIRILPDFASKEVNSLRYSLALNQDSFPEIHPDIVCNYLEWFKQSVSFFLSINHENCPNSVDGKLQNNVSELLRNAGGYDLYSRQLYWLRKGYVMELYKNKAKELTLPPVTDPLPA